jgi:hypothetical protein
MSTVSCGVCGSSCLKGSMYVCGECATKASGTQPTDAQQLKAEIRSLLANYESDVVLRGAPKSEGWFFNRLRELSAV